jgi:hypothetical protein
VCCWGRGSGVGGRGLGIGGSGSRVSWHDSLLGLGSKMNQATVIHAHSFIDAVTKLGVLGSVQRIHDHYQI